MGQTASSAAHVHEYPLLDVHTLFSFASQRLVTPVEAPVLRKKLNSVTINEKAQLAKADLAQLMLLDDFSVLLIYDYMLRAGKFPLWGSDKDLILTADELVVAAVLLGGRYKKLKLNLNYDQLLFSVLATPESGSFAEKFDVELKTVTFLEDVPAKDDLMNASRHVDWSKFEAEGPLFESKYIDKHIDSGHFVSLLTLFLIIYSIPQRKRPQMYAEFQHKLTQRRPYEAVAKNFVHYTSSSAKISFSEYKQALPLLQPLLAYGFEFLVDVLFSDTATESDTVADETISKLVNEPTISLLSAILAGMGGKLAGISLSRKNLVKLYLGSESGFSIRSLELKIFKWHAPTILLVSGKRLKTSNKRYETFDSEYPRYFRSLENPLRDWQHANDTITYAVLVHQPWKISNKMNFGDFNTTIISLQPFVNVFKGRTPESIYFNTLGMGLGFGNAQPINKNTVRRYCPGSVSLTIEANLEYAVFRHIPSLANSGLNFFQTASQPDLSRQDYEDRFLITDLEVWGVGSTKELEEQRKQWEWEKKLAEARQSVNLNSMKEDRALLEMVGLVGNHGLGGSV